ncbi:MAG: MFS transporter [Bacteroidales bacterium]|nr:MFS transporter [Bacteroidales bacterium]
MTKGFRLWNNLTGWAVFALSLLVYLLTIEPTVSFWDCGEFILCSYRLEVGHPPGAPFFLLLGRFFTFFAGGDTSKVAMMVNILSAFASAFTILFLFWTITRLIRLATGDNESVSGGRAFAILGAGIAGALAYAFSDTFWFSAVEGEVYATSSLFTAAVFWAMLRWYDEADDPHSGRWIILIAYLMGLSIGVHLLNLLALPVIVLLWYFRKHTATAKGIITSLVAGFLILGVLNFIFVPGVAKIAGWFELFFVNTLGLPYNTGLYIYLVILTGLIVAGIWYSLKKGRKVLNFVMTVIAVLMLGYSSFALIIIRANAHPPMNQNDPSDVFSFLYYINRSQYPRAPFLYGHYYSAPVTGIDKKVGGYNKKDGRYEPYYMTDYTYDKRFMTLFPRMYSTDPDHIRQYQYWGKIKGKKVTVRSGGGSEQVIIPTFGENLRFFFRYQVGVMYMRYFMWNFSGRQNDVQGNGNVMDGNWISGIPFIDNPRLGDQSLLPEENRNNPARNAYYLLPLLAGLAGIWWHYRRDGKGLTLVVVLFLMTGLAIVTYLNQYPSQPRERDYAYAGSFYAFTIWIGMSVMLIYDLLRKLMKEYPAAVIPSALIMAAVPLLMLIRNYDDHDRSDRYTARDIASNYLASVDQNAVLLTYGDNDSFPLWYIQDVEGYRTDVRVANLSYLQSGFYIETMSRKAFESDPLPFTLPYEKYIEGERVQLPVEDLIKEPTPIRKVIEFAGSDDPKAKIDLSGRGDYFNFIPVREFIIDVDSANVIATGAVRSYHADRMLKPMIWKFSGNMAIKDDLAVMDFMAGNNWERPLYYSVTVPASTYIGLEDFFVLEGMAFRVSPIIIDPPQPGETGMVDTQEMYENMMTNFRWGNAEKEGVYLDENNRRMFDVFRRQFAKLAKALVAEGDTVRAVAAIEKGMAIVPPEKMPFDYFSCDLAEALAVAGKKEEAEKLFREIIDNSLASLGFIAALPDNRSYGLEFNASVSLQALLDIYRLATGFGMTELAETASSGLNRYYGEVPVR